MKRNVFVVFGLGALFSAGIFAPGCSSSSSSPSKDSGYDTAREDSAGGTGGAAIDGPAGHGGSLDVATGAGGSAELDAAPDTAKSDAAPDLVVQHDVADAQPDVPLNYPDGPAPDRTADLPGMDMAMDMAPPQLLDAAPLDGGQDTLAVVFDVAPDSEIDTGSGQLLDSGIDGVLDGALDGVDGGQD